MQWPMHTRVTQQMMPTPSKRTRDLRTTPRAMRDSSPFMRPPSALTRSYLRGPSPTPPIRTLSARAQSRGRDASPITRISTALQDRNYLRGPSPTPPIRTLSARIRDSSPGPRLNATSRNFFQMPSPARPHNYMRASPASGLSNARPQSARPPSRNTRRDPYPLSHSQSSHRAQTQPTETVTSAVAIAQWLYSLGVTHLTAEPKSLDEILPGIRDGTMLCDTVEIVCGHKILGVFKKPRTAATRLANINKALEALRRKHGMSHRLVWQDNAIANGDETVIVGLFEDIRAVYESGGRATPRKTPRRTPRTARSYQPTTTIANDRIYSSIPSPARIISPPHVPIAPERYAAYSSTTLDDNVLPAPVPPPSITASDLVAPPRFSTTAPPQQQESVREPSEGYLLLQWLQSLGIRTSSLFILDAPVSKEFSDGIILCDLVGKLEHKTLTGVTRQPKSNASNLHNINKALEQLRLKKVRELHQLLLTVIAEHERAVLMVSV